MPDLIQRANRKTLALSIMKDGRVIVKAPHRMSDKLISKFIQDKQGWLKSKLDIIKKTNAEFEDCINYRSLLLYGEKYQICVGNVKRVMRDDVRKIIVAPNASKTSDVINKIKTWYKKLAKEILTERTKHIADAIKIQPGQIRLTNAKGKWGSCNLKKSISLNWRMIMLTPELIDYVIIHELCHVKELNHSSMFWKTVEMFLPNYQALRKNLKKYSFTLELYR